MDAVQLDPFTQDTLVWRWTPDGAYSSASAYRAFFQGRVTMRGAKEIWAVRCPHKVKFFFWIALHGRLWTAERRMRHGLQQNDDCTLCDQHAEHADHLLLSCPFSRQVWYAVLLWAGLPALLAQGQESLLDWWLRSRNEVSGALRRGFDSTTLLTAWMIWKERNRRTFDAISSTSDHLARKTKEEAAEWVAAGFRDLAIFTSP